MVRYKQIFKQMLDENRIIFDEFKRIHDRYMLEPKPNQEEFNQKGENILGIIKDYEDKLCHYSEKGMYAKFSAGLSEKFQEEVRKIFPKIDFVGVKIQSPFEVKKIKLNS